MSAEKFAPVPVEQHDDSNQIQVDPMPDHMTRQVVAFRHQVKDAHKCALSLKRDYGTIPYVWSILTAALTAAAACRIQVYVSDHSKTHLSHSVREMYMRGFLVFIVASLILFFWWLTTRKHRASRMDELCDKISDLNYPAPSPSPPDESP